MRPQLSVVICCYTDERLAGLAAAVAAVTEQLCDKDELIIVVDGNDGLCRRLRNRYGDSATPGRSTVVPNTFRRGLSGARNTGVHTATGDVLVFLDDDAVPAPDALAAVRSAFDDPAIVALGGAVRPLWASGREPRWFPEEFGWVVGCDYRGLPPDGAPIRNPIGAAMAVRRAPLVAVGGFSDLLGRIDGVPAGCEETLMGIALTRCHPDARIIRRTSFRVQHTVPPDRMSVSYFLRRCYHEGLSKAVLTRLCGRQAALTSERRYVFRTLPAALWYSRRQPSRLLAVAAGLTVTGVGYLTGLVKALRAG